MQVNAKRRAGQLRGNGIGKFEAPRNVSRLANAAASHKTTNAANRMAQRNGGHAAIERGKQRHFLEVRIEEHGEHAAGQTSVERAAGLEHGDTENFAGVRGVVVPGGEDEPNFGKDQRAEHQVNSHAPEFVRIETDSRGLAAAIPKAQQYAGGDQHAIAENGDSADLEKYGVHVCARACVGCLPSRNKASTTSAAPTTIAESAMLNVYQ